jgi:hypothetical protein
MTGIGHDADGGFALVQAAFERAAVSCPGEVRESHLQLAGRPARLRIVGAALAEQIGEALAHLCDVVGNPGAPVAGIDLWDRATTGVDVQTPGLRPEQAWQTHGYRVSTFGGNRFLRHEQRNRLLILDRGLLRVAGAYDSGSGLTLEERSRPLVWMLALLYRSLAAQRVHGGLVARAGRGVLLCGPGGAGKTSCALDGLVGGLDFLGDDTVGIERRRDGELVGHSLYASARVVPAHLARWPEMQLHAIRPPVGEQNKALLFPYRFLRQRIARRARVVALVLVRQSSEARTRIARAPRVDVFRALVPGEADTQRFGFDAEDFARLTDLVQRLPCYLMEPGPEPSEVATGLARLLDEAPA